MEAVYSQGLTIITQLDFYRENRLAGACNMVDGPSFPSSRVTWTLEKLALNLKTKGD